MLEDDNNVDDDSDRTSIELAESDFCGDKLG